MTRTELPDDPCSFHVPASFDPLSCPSCAKPFTSTDNVPLILACGDSCCSTCVKQPHSFKCPRPLCQKVTSETGCLPTNLALLELVQAPKLNPPQCPSHQQALVLYCPQDRKLICLVCREFEHKDHTGILPVFDAAKNKRAELQQVRNQARAAQNLQQHTAAIVKARDETKMASSKARTDAENYFKQLHSDMVAAKTSVLRTIDDQEFTMNLEFATQLSELEKAVAELRCVEDEAQKMCQLNDTQILQAPVKALPQTEVLARACYSSLEYTMFLPTMPKPSVDYKCESCHDKVSIDKVGAANDAHVPSRVPPASPTPSPSPLPTPVPTPVAPTPVAPTTPIAPTPVLMLVPLPAPAPAVTPPPANAVVNDHNSYEKLIVNSLVLAAECLSAASASVSAYSKAVYGADDTVPMAVVNTAAAAAAAAAAIAPQAAGPGSAVSSAAATVKAAAAVARAAEAIVAAVCLSDLPAATVVGNQEGKGDEAVAKSLASVTTLLGSAYSSVDAMCAFAAADDSRAVLAVVAAQSAGSAFRASRDAKDAATVLDSALAVGASAQAVAAVAEGLKGLRR